jgi:multiple sugar transport system substrate-binding protein
MTSRAFPRRKFLGAALATAALPLARRAAAQAQPVVFMSTQLRPIEQAQALRQRVLRGAPAPVEFIPEQAFQLTVRLRAEQEAGRRTVSLVGAVHGELQPLVPMNVLEPIDDVAATLADRGIPPTLMQLGKFGTAQQLYVPWMQATYIMVAHRQALPHLPAGADIGALSYDQLMQWAANMRQASGQRRLGFPAGPQGLMPRLFQGYLYPSFTGSAVSAFRSAEAERMWTWF